MLAAFAGIRSAGSLRAGCGALARWSSHKASSSPGSIIIRGFDDSVTTQTLQDTFASFGEVVECQVPAGKASRPKKHGYVQFKDAAAAQKAIKEMNGALLNNKKVQVEPRLALPELLESTFNNVHVGNVSPETTLESLKQLFSPYGNIISAVLPVDKDGKHKGYAFVAYSTHSEAKNAISSLHGQNSLAVTRFKAWRERKHEAWLAGKAKAQE